MNTIKFTAAKTQELKSAINLLDMYRFKSSLADIKAQAKISGFDVKGRTFKAIYSQLVAIYENALNIEEAKTLTVTL